MWGISTCAGNLDGKLRYPLSLPPSAQKDKRFEDSRLKTQTKLPAKVVTSTWYCPECPHTPTGQSLAYHICRAFCCWGGDRKHSPVLRCGFRYSKAPSYQVFLFLCIYPFYSLSKRSRSVLFTAALYLCHRVMMDQIGFLPLSCQEMDVTSQSPHCAATCVHLRIVPERGNKAQGHFKRNVFQQSLEKTKM